MDPYLCPFPFNFGPMMNGPPFPPPNSLSPPLLPSPSGFFFVNFLPDLGFFGKDGDGCRRATGTIGEEWSLDWNMNDKGLSCHSRMVFSCSIGVSLCVIYRGMSWW